MRGPAIRDSREGGVLDCSVVVCTESSSPSVTNSILSLCSSCNDAQSAIEAKHGEGRTPVDHLAIVL